MNLQEQQEMIYDNAKNELYNLSKTLLLMVEQLIDRIEKENLQNEQFTLDFLDKLNELSIKF